MKNTRQTAMMEHLLKGKYISIKTAYTYFGVSNPAREVSRLIEQPLNIVLDRKAITRKTKYGTSCTYFEYRLENKDRKKVSKYLASFVKSQKSK